MKICNFRPLCWLAGCVLVAAAACQLSPWSILVGVVMLVLILPWLKVPRWFKLTALVLYTVVAVNFLLTTLWVANPAVRSYDPNAGLRGIILHYVDWLLKNFLSVDNANLVYSMLFGDKSGLSWTLQQNYSVAGLAHMFAVSGLHVGLLAISLERVLRWVRVPRRAQLYVIAPVLVFYAYLCSWRYAVLRALIMYLVHAVARQHLQVTDSLSTMAMAMIIIVTLFPYAVVSASFWLSFACVLGIIISYQAFYRIIPVWGVAMYLAVMTGSLPFAIYYFGYLPLLGVVANVILIPILVGAFYAGWLAVVTCVCGAVLWLVEPLLTFASAVCSAVASLPGSILLVSSSWWPIPIYLLGLMVLSRFIFLKPKFKYPFAIALLACYFLLLMV